MVEEVTTPRRGRPPVASINRVDTFDREPKGRSERVPLGALKPSLGGKSRPGYMSRWINDTGARVEQALMGGYEFKFQDGTDSTDPGNRISKIADKSTGMRAYLMEILEEFYVADQEAKQKPINELEAQIKRGSAPGGEPGVDGRYIPSAGISISRK